MSQRTLSDPEDGNTVSDAEDGSVTDDGMSSGSASTARGGMGASPALSGPDQERVRAASVASGADSCNVVIEVSGVEGLPQGVSKV